MIHLSAVLKNPFSSGNFKALYNKFGKISENKCWEIELSYDDTTLASAGLDLSWSGYHHAGPNIKLGLLGYEFFATIYDVRHWNARSRSWVIETGI